MEIAFVIGIVALSAALLGHRLLSKAGFGKPDGKPDCGCGTCAKRKGQP